MPFPALIQRPFALFLPAFLGALLPFISTAAAERASLPLEWVEKQAITVDGRLDEPVYREGQWQSGFKEPATHRPTGYDTRFRLFTDGDRLYLSAILDEPTGQVVAELTRHDDRLWNDDCIELFLSCDHDKTTFLQVIVNAKGVMTDREYEQGGMVSNTAWNPLSKAAVEVGKAHWSVELAIPLADLKIDPSLREWSVQVARERSARGEERKVVAAWSPTPTLLSPGSFGALKLPDFDRSIFGWKLKTGPERIGRRGDEYFLQQRLYVTNDTGSYQNVVVTSRLENGDRAAATREFGVAPGRAQNYVAEVPLGREPQAKGILTHTVALARTPEGRLASTGAAVEAGYVSARLVLKQPGYRATLFATQKIRTLLAALVRVDEEVTIHEVSAKLTTGDGKELPGTVEAGEGEWKIVVPGVDAIGEGTHRLRVSFMEGERKVSLEREIQKVPYRPYETWIDEKGVIHRDGKPLPAYGFCFGIWGDVERTRMPGMFFNIANPIWAVPPFEKMKEEAANLARFGILSAVYVPTASSIKGNEKGDAPLTPQEREDYRALAEAVSENPNIFAYYQSDEPEGSGIGPKRLREIYDILAEADPYRPVIMLNYSVAGVRDYQYAGDISNPDPYLLLMQGGGSPRPPDRPGQFLSQIVTGEESYRAKWMTPQAYNAGFFSSRGGRGPTAREMRTQQVNGLINGVVGFTWYNQYMAWDEPGVFTSLPYLSREYKALFPLLVKARPEIISTQPEEAVGLAISREGKALLMVANLVWQEREITFEDARLGRIANWKKLGTSETVPGGKTEMTVRLGPYESMILASQAVDFPATLEWGAVEREEAAVRAQLAVPGNIAHASTGARATTVNFGGRGGLRAMMAIDGMKDPRGNGFSRRGFQSGSGIEITFAGEAKPRRLKLIGSNIREGSVEIEENGEWKPVAPIVHEDGRFEREIALPGTKTKGLRIIAQSCTDEEAEANSLVIREVEVYED
ncbi:MAG TPA: sugar-binding protein [Chthoniobacteraceae bacterium]|nr:sugar-binding protein [Chthoniobacteraceae bacterium]